MMTKDFWQKEFGFKVADWPEALRYRDEAKQAALKLAVGRVGSRCDIVGRAVASDYRRTGFKSSHEQFSLNIHFLLAVPIQKCQCAIYLYMSMLLPSCSISRCPCFWLATIYQDVRLCFCPVVRSLCFWPVVLWVIKSLNLNILGT